MKLDSNRWVVQVDITKILLGLMMFFGLLTGLLPQTLIDIAVLAICVGLLFTGDLILAYPFMLFYYGTFGLVMGVSTYRLYSLLLLLDTFLKITKRLKVRLEVLPPILVYVLYLLVVMSSYDIQRTVFCFIDILCVLSVVVFLNEDASNIRKFFKLYAVVSVVAIISGVILNNVLIEDRVMEDYIISRFEATFEDPNYMGFFLSIAVFATVAMKLFKPIIQWIVIAVIYAAILASASMTAIVVHIILWPVYLILAKKINLKVFIACIVIIVLALGLYQYGLENPEAPLVGNTAYRIQEKLVAWEAGDMAAVTTSRSDLTEEHWQYFTKQPFIKKLFGGTSVNTIFITEEFEMAAHNEYVDMLLNIGILGTAIMLWYMFSNTFKHLKECYNNNNETQIGLFMIKCVWIAYAATLTMFMEWRFMLPFFI